MLSGPPWKFVSTDASLGHAVHKKQKGQMELGPGTRPLGGPHLRDTRPTLGSRPILCAESHDLQVVMQDWGTSPGHLASLGPPGSLAGPLPTCIPWAVPPQLVMGWAPPFLSMFHYRSLLPLLPTVARQGRATGVTLGASGTPRACPQSSDGPLVWPPGVLRETSLM